jgi:lantibiotic biosynthesis protein
MMTPISRSVGKVNGFSSSRSISSRAVSRCLGDIQTSLASGAKVTPGPALYTLGGQRLLRMGQSLYPEGPMGKPRYFITAVMSQLGAVGKPVRRRWLPARPLIGVRVPLLPIDLAVDLATRRPTAPLIAELLTDNSWLMDALQVASPSLHGATERWLLGGDVPSRRLLSRVRAYIVRASSRATPFGLFAAFGLVKDFEASTSLAINLESLRTCTRPDMRWLYALRDHLHTEWGYDGGAVLWVNRLMVERDGRLHIWRSDGVVRESTGFRNVPSSVRASPLIIDLLRFAEDGKTADECAGFVRDVYHKPHDDAKAIVEGLIKAEALLAEDRFSLIGNPWGEFISKCRVQTVKDSVCRIDAMIREIDSVSVFKRRDSYKKVVAAMQEQMPVDHTPIQTDCVVDFNGALGQNVLDAVEQYVEIHLRASSVYEAANYRDAIMLRLEGTKRFIPLLALMSPASGLSVRGQVHGPQSGSSVNTQLRQQALVELVLRAVADRTREVALSKQELESLLLRDLPSDSLESFETVFAICAKSLAGVNRGEFLLAPAGFIASTGAGHSAARFTHALNDLSEVMERYRAESSGLRADILYEPPIRRFANMMVRTHGERYHIPLGVVSPPSSRCLDPRHLYVGLVDGKLALWSEELGEFIRPVTGNMLATDQAGPDIPRFLSALGRDGMNINNGFSWMKTVRHPFVPRLRHERFVLNKAFWNLASTSINTIEDVKRQVELARKRYDLPQQVYLAEEDHLLLIDLEDVDALEFLCAQAKAPHSESVRLEEVLPTAEDCWVTDGLGRRYAAEFVASALRRRDGVKMKPQLHPTVTNVHDVTRPPGADWVYFRLHCGAGSHDRLIAGHIQPLVELARSRFGVTDWHFVRYTYPEDHLRIRFSAPETWQLLSAVGERIRSLCDRGFIWAFDIGTYAREVERYGGIQSMVTAEAMFTASSDAAMDWLRKGQSTEEARIKEAILSFHELVAALLSNDQRLHWLRALTGPKTLSNDERALVKDIFGQTRHRQRSEKYALTRELLRLDAEGNISEPLPNVLNSLLHMHFNRFGIVNVQEVKARRIQWHLYRRLENAPPWGSE